MVRPRFFPFYRLFPFPFSHFESKFRQFFEGTSLFSAPNFNFSSLFPVFTHASGTSSRDPPLYYRHTPSLAQREGFFISCFPHSSRPAPPLSPDLLPFRLTITPPSSLPPPLSFSFLPTFPSPSPINARTRALTRNTRVCVRPHTLTRQEVFFYCLHRFTHPSQSTVYQRIIGEEKTRKSLHQKLNHLTIKTLTQNTRFHPL